MQQTDMPEVQEKSESVWQQAPGATNLVTGIATAYMDSIPIVAITCNVGVSLLGKDSFQEIDIAGITTPITKYSFIVKDVTKLADTIRRAFSIARKGRPPGSGRYHQGCDCQQNRVYKERAKNAAAGLFGIQ